MPRKVLFDMGEYEKRVEPNLGNEKDRGDTRQQMRLPLEGYSYQPPATKESGSSSEMV
jgi:hypothetical protein